MVSVANTEWGPEEITIKYLEPGHTYMKADCVHEIIGKRMKHTPEIVSFKELTNLVNLSGSRIEVLEMNIDNFYIFKAGSRARSTKKIQLPLLSDILEVKFVKGSRLLYYKCCHESEEYTGVDFLKVKFELDPLPQCLTTPRGIPTKKKDGILQILKHVGALRRTFYSDLRCNDTSEDLVTEFDL